MKGDEHMKTHDFNKSIIVGNAGERTVINFLKNRENVKSIREVQELKVFRDKDIDLIVELKDNRNYSVEIKTDTYNSGNIFYETMSSVETESLGCMEKTEADYLFYYFVYTKELYILDMKKYRNWFYVNKSNFQLKILKNKRFDASTYTSMGYTIPKKYLENNFKNYKKLMIA